MGLIEIASANSVWRGIDYYEAKKVLEWDVTGQYTYGGTVSGSSGQVYHVHVDKAHPKRSTCDCAFAKGRKVVCKHMLAIYFTAEPEELDAFKMQVEQWEKEEEEREREEYEDLRRYVYSLSKAQLQEELLIALEELRERENRWHY